MARIAKEAEMRMSRLKTGALTVVAGGLMVGLVGGVTLGSFATGRMKFSADAPTFAEQVGNPEAAYGDGAGYGDINASPAEAVVCKGCGPGISERMETQYSFGYDDRAVRAWIDYRPDPPITTQTLGTEAAANRPAAQPGAATRQPGSAAQGPQPVIRSILPPADLPIEDGPEQSG